MQPYAAMHLPQGGGPAPQRPKQTTYAPGEGASNRLDPSYIGAISKASDTALGGMRQLGDALGNAGKAFGAVADMFGRGDALRRYRGYMADLDDALYNKDTGLISSTKGESAFDIERAVQAKQRELRGKWLDGSSRLLGVPAYFDMMAYDYDRKTYSQGVQHSASEFNRWMPQQYGAMADVFMQKAQASAGDPIASQQYFDAALNMTERGMRFNGAGDAEVLRQFQRMDHDWVSGQIGALCDQGRWDEAQALLTGGRFARVDMGARLPGGGTLGGSYSNQVEALSRQWNGKPYSMDGPRDPNRGSTDCSGLVSHAILAMSQGPNAIFDEATARRMIGGGTSDAIVQNIASLSGRPLMGRDQLTPDRVQPGTVIGLDTGKRGWDADHWNGIDHVVMTFEKDGAPWVFESAGGKGVRSLPYSQWLAETLKRHPGAVFYGTNALALSRAPQGGTQQGQPGQEAGTTAGPEGGQLSPQAGTEAEQPAAGEGTPPPAAPPAPAAGGTTPGAAGGATGTARAASTAGIEPMPQNFNSALSYEEAARTWARIQAGKKGQQLAAEKQAKEAERQAKEQHEAAVRQSAAQAFQTTSVASSDAEQAKALNDVERLLPPEDRKLFKQTVDGLRKEQKEAREANDLATIAKFDREAAASGASWTQQLNAVEGLPISREAKDKLKKRINQEANGDENRLESAANKAMFYQWRDENPDASDEDINAFLYGMNLNRKDLEACLQYDGISAAHPFSTTEPLIRSVVGKKASDAAVADIYAALVKRMAGKPDMKPDQIRHEVWLLNQSGKETTGFWQSSQELRDMYKAGTERFFRPKPTEAEEQEFSKRLLNRMGEEFTQLPEWAKGVLIRNEILRDRYGIVPAPTQAEKDRWQKETGKPWPEQKPQTTF